MTSAPFEAPVAARTQRPRQLPPNDVPTRSVHWFVDGLIVPCFFTGIGCLITGKVLFSSGIIAGGDWSTPVTKLQFETTARSGLFLWTHVANLFGTAQSYLTTLTYGLFFAASRALDGPDIDRIFLLFLFGFAGTSVYAFARFLHLSRPSALLAGALFIATPVFFNYTAMGWGFILVAFSLTPWLLLLFARSVETGGMLPALLLSLIFVIGFSFASQCIVWYPVALLTYIPFLVRSRAECWRAARCMLLCGVIFVLLNLHWVLPLASYGDTLLSSAALESDVPLGQRLTVTNIIRGWGSLFNWPYETSYPSSLVALSFLPSLVCYATFLFRPRDWRPRFLGLLALVPLVFFLLPDAVYEIPFTSVVRDGSRFILFHALGSSLLAAIAVDSLLTKPTLTKSASPISRRSEAAPKILAGGLAGTLLLAAYPVWAGELTSTAKNGFDIRLRSLTLSPAHHEVERRIERAPGSSKALYLPAGLFVNVPSDRRFSGSYAELSDSFAAYSPKPGAVFAGDRRPGEYRAVASFINSGEFLSSRTDLAEMLGAMGIRWVVVRRQFEGHAYSTSDLLKRLETEAGLIRRNDGDVLLYENSRALPIIYASTEPRFSDASTRAGVPGAFGSGFALHRRVAFFRDSARGSNGRPVPPEEPLPYPSVSFRKVNPTRFDIRVDHATQPFFLVLLETYDPRWRLVPMSKGVRLPPAKPGETLEAPVRTEYVWSDASLTRPRALPESTHFRANGYANSWYIDPADGRSPLTFRATFAPQALSYAGALLAIFALVIVLGATVILAASRWPLARRLPGSLRTKREEFDEGAG